MVTWPTASPCGAHGRRFGAEMAVGVDLHLDAAIGEDALGDDGDQIDALDLLADDEGRRLVVGIGGAGADRGDEAAAGVDQFAVPLPRLRRERHDGAAGSRPLVEDGQRVHAHDPAADIAVAVAGAGAAVGDVAHDRTGIAADLLRHLLLAGIMRLEAFGKLAHARASLSRIAAQDARRRRRHLGHQHAGGVADGVEDRRRGRDQHMLAQPLGAERSFRIGNLDQDGLDRRHVADGRDQIVVQILGAAGDVFLHQRHADALRDAALDLAFDQQRVDRLADIVRGGDLDQLHRAELQVDLEFGDLRAIAIDGVGLALALGVERQRRRIVGFLGAEDEAVGIGSQRGEIDAAGGFALADDDQAAPSRASVAFVRDIGEAQDLFAQRAAGLFRRLAGDEGLARGRGLAGVGRDRRCRRSSAGTSSSGRPSASAQICAMTVLEPWPISTAP